ncbi:MAG: hypothetical protein V4629_07260 [Pseudomonadota bacterium]
MVSIISGYSDANHDNKLSAGDTVSLNGRPETFSIIEGENGLLYADLDNDGAADIEVDAADSEPDFEVDSEDIAEFEENENGGENSDNPEEEDQEDQVYFSQEEYQEPPFDILGIFALLRELIELSTDRMNRELENFGTSLETQASLLKFECLKIREEGRHAATQTLITGIFSIVSGVGSLAFMGMMRPSSSSFSKSGGAGIKSNPPQSPEVNITPSTTPSAQTTKALSDAGAAPNRVKGKQDDAPSQDAEPGLVRGAANDHFKASTYAQAWQSITQGIGGVASGPFKIYEFDARAESTKASGQRSIESQMASLIQSWYSESKEDRSALDQLIKDTCRSIESAR